jgi:ADP-heptose:LPS heptosyltransferase
VALRRNVLILHTGALGDFVLCWPLVLALGRIHPQSRIIVVTQASKGALAERALRVESADIEHGWHGLFAVADANASIDPRVAMLIDGAHAIYSFLSDAGDTFAKNLAARAPEAKIVSLRTIPPDGWNQHASQWLLEQLAAHPAVKSAVEQILRSVASRGIGTGRSHDGDVVVHPGSGSPEKCWPLQRFVELIERLRRARRDVRVLLGEVELERFSGVEIKSLESLATVRKPANYLELYNELRSAAELVANDSGPGHLGAIVGVPTLALFGPASDPAVWKPLGPHVSTLREETMEKLTVAKVFAAAKALAGG